MKDTRLAIQSNPKDVPRFTSGWPLPLIAAMGSFPAIQVVGPHGPLMTLRQAAAYLNVSPRWLEAQDAVPHVDLAKPGARKAMPRYWTAGLDEFMARRTVEGRD